MPGPWLIAAPVCVEVDDAERDAPVGLTDAEPNFAEPTAPAGAADAEPNSDEPIFKAAVYPGTGGGGTADAEPKSAEPDPPAEGAYLLAA
jgi:hypothetical protein